MHSMQLARGTQQHALVTHIPVCGAAAAQVTRRPRSHICHAALHEVQRCCRRRAALRVSAAAAAAAASPEPSAAKPRFSLKTVLGWLPDKQSLQLVADAWALLYRNLWAIVAVFLAKDAAAFILHRVVHRLTNQVAESALNIPISSVGNPWWIMSDPKFMEGHTGYQVLVGIFFLLCLPLNILFNTAAVSTATVVVINRQASLSGRGVPTASFTGQGRGKVGLADYPRPPPPCTPDAEECDISNDVGSSSSSSSSGSSSSGTTAAVLQAPAAAPAVQQQQQEQQVTPAPAVPPAQLPNGASSNSSSSSSNGGVQLSPAPAVPWLTVVQERSKPPPRLGLRASLAAAQEAWREQVSCRLKALWQVDLLFNLWALPLQAASLAVLPVFWTFPRLLGIQLALPAAVLGGARGKQALDTSRGLMAGFQSSYAWPFVWLIVAGRLLETVRELVLLSMPNRWWTDVPEVPLAATAVFFAARVLLLRVQDMLPVAAYLLLVRRQGGGAAATAAAAAEGEGSGTLTT